MIFRWSLWGNKHENCEMLRYSIKSFLKWFGKNHQYIVFTDDKTFVSKHLPELIDVRQFPNDRNTLFNIQSRATWLKWCPNSRLDISQTEFYIDSDVFLLKHPTEVYTFLSNEKYKFAVLDEFKGERWQHGALKNKSLPDTPFINAGFFIQKASYDITPELLNEYYWWKENIKEEEQTHHDEQGCLAIALAKYLFNNELYIFPKDKYPLISNDQNANKENIDDVTLFHSTYPDHPAFYKYRPFLSQILNE